ncbi:hypothetical protein ACGIF2_00500 [Cellulomonas sp. P22]|uniref:hypothetical protein n=1 Tax=Cellulomonas sp. P22 TaxID=3373189 RepID=UPI003799752C
MGPGPEEPDDDAIEHGSDASAEDSVAPVPTDEERWAAIVAELGELDQGAPQGPAVTYPVAPWVSDPRVVRAANDAADEPSVTGRDWDGTRQIDEAEALVDEDEHFVPPDPGPVLGGDPLLTMAWLAAGGMPVLLLVIVIAWQGAPSALIQAAGVVFLLGVGVLVWRMPNRRDDADDDTGAVV